MYPFVIVEKSILRGLFSGSSHPHVPTKLKAGDTVNIDLREGRVSFDRHGIELRFNHDHAFTSVAMFSLEKIVAHEELAKLIATLVGCTCVLQEEDTGTGLVRYKLMKHQ